MIVAAVTILISMAKSGHFFKSLFLTIIQGIVALFAVNVIGMLTGVVIPLNWYTIGTSAFLGIPGVIMIIGLLTLNGT